MTRIKNYEELELEKARLQSRLTLQKDKIYKDVDVIRENLDPFFRILSFFNGPKNGPASVLKAGAQAGVGFLAQRTFSKVGWLARLVAPALLGGVTGTLLDGLKRRLSRNGRQS